MSYFSRISTAVLLLALGLLVTTSLSQAATISDCTDGPVLDLTLGCTHPGNNDFETDVEDAIFEALGIVVDITLLGKSDEPAPFSYTPGDGASVNNSTFGTWTADDPNTEVAFLSVAGGGLEFAVYQLFPPASSGDYTSMGILNAGGQQPTVSHLSFWSCADCSEPPPPTEPNPIPEPSSLLLLGSGAVAWALVRRRSRKQS